MESVFMNIGQILQDWFDAAVANMPQYLMGLVIFVISFYISRWLKKFVIKTLKSRKTDPELVILLGRVTQWTVIIVGTVLALQQAGQDVSALVAGFGVLGFTIGFALQDISTNIVAGILLLIQQPFEIGDAIEVAGYSGVVQTVNIRATEILTFDGKWVTIPNSDVFSTSMINFSRNTVRRIALEVGVGYESDLKQVEQICLDTINAIPGVLADKPPAVVFHTFADSAINLTIYYWLDTEKNGYFDMQTAGVFAIKKAFAENNIDIPFPVQTIIQQQ